MNKGTKLINDLTSGLIDIDTAITALQSVPDKQLFFDTDPTNDLKRLSEYYSKLDSVSIKEIELLQQLIVKSNTEQTYKQKDRNRKLGFYFGNIIRNCVKTKSSKTEGLIESLRPKTIRYMGHLNNAFTAENIKLISPEAFQIIGKSQVNSINNDSTGTLYKYLSDNQINYLKKNKYFNPVQFPDLGIKNVITDMNDTIDAITETESNVSIPSKDDGINIKTDVTSSIGKYVTDKESVIKNTETKSEPSVMENKETKNPEKILEEETSSISKYVTDTKKPLPSIPTETSDVKKYITDDIDTSPAKPLPTIPSDMSSPQKPLPKIPSESPKKALPPTPESSDNRLTIETDEINSVTSDLSVSSINTDNKLSQSSVGMSDMVKKIKSRLHVFDVVSESTDYGYITTIEIGDIKVSVNCLMNILTKDSNKFKPDECSDSVNKILSDGKFNFDKIIKTKHRSGDLMKDKKLMIDLYRFVLGTCKFLEKNNFSKMEMDAKVKIYEGFKDIIKVVLEYIQNFMTNNKVITNNVIAMNYNLLYLLFRIVSKQNSVDGSIDQINVLYKKLDELTAENIKAYSSIDRSRIMQTTNTSKLAEMDSLVSDLKKQISVLEKQRKSLFDNVFKISKDAGRLETVASSTMKDLIKDIF